MARIEQVIEVNVPLSKVYEKLTKFEEFPRFMQGVHAVRQLDDTHLHWRAEIGGKEAEWDAEITEQVEGQHIAWRNTSGPKSEGKVSFEAVTQDMTRITLTMDAEEAALRHPDMKKSRTPKDEHDLARFKRMIEKEQQSSAAGSEGGDISDMGESAAAYSAQLEQGSPARQSSAEDSSRKPEARAADSRAASMRAGRRNIDREVNAEEEQKTASEAKPASLPFMQGWEDPFGLMRRMGEEMEEFFGRWGVRAVNPWLPGRSVSGMRDWTPPLDIAQHGSQLVICADLPGIRKEDVQIEINGGMLTITGERHADQTQVRQASRRSERYHGYFYRAVDLPEGVDPNAAQASMHDGVLEITLPVQAQTGKNRRVDIQPSA